MSLHYIIDGYNVVRHRLFVPVKKSYDERNALVFLLQQGRLAGSARNRITVVFDGYPEANMIEKKEAAVDVVYSRGVSADDTIKKIVDSSGNPKIMVVVSDDREVRFFARGAGARVMSVAEFLSVKKTKTVNRRGEDIELNYSQVENINEELRRLWLKRPEK